MAVTSGASIKEFLCPTSGFGAVEWDSMAVGSLWGALARSRTASACRPGVLGVSDDPVRQAAEEIARVGQLGVDRQ
jgi:hypothetical protein